VKIRTIVFIHGMFMTPLCWEHWVDRFQAKGYRCIAWPWPGRTQPVARQRQLHPDPQLGKLKLRDVVESAASAIKALNEKPALIGHSMGGLVVQLLLQQDLALAGAVIDSAPPMGVFTPAWSFLKSNLPAINPFVPVSRPIEMSLAQFQYAFVNTLPLAEQRAAYDRYVVPESRGVPTQALTAVAKIDFRRAHLPLLITAGGKDHIIPASLCRTNFNRYGQSPSVTEFKLFPGRDHFFIGETGWEELADYVLGWLNDKAQ
jgi:pimeloyl-ACP methyl ester carboxylesterase